MDIERYRGVENFCCKRHEIYLGYIMDLFPGEHIDAIQVNSMVRLKEETADFLYKEYTPLETHYKPGSRILLELLARRITEGKETDRAKAQAIMNWLHENLYLKAPEYWTIEGKRNYYGGTEEDLIRWKTRVCNELSRCFVVLCQICGIPARIVYILHVIGEAFLQGKWAVFDMNINQCYLLPDGRLASAWDIMQDRGILKRHPRADKIPEHYKDYYKLVGICNYFSWQDYPQRYFTRFLSPTKAEMESRRREAEEKMKKYPPCPVLGDI